LPDNLLAPLFYVPEAAPEPPKTRKRKASGATAATSAAERRKHEKAIPANAEVLDIEDDEDAAFNAPVQK